MSNDTSNTDIPEEPPQWAVDAIAQQERFVGENAKLDLAANRGTLGEFTHILAEEARQDYESNVDPNGDVPSTESSESNDRGIADLIDETVDAIGPGRGPDAE